MRHRAAAWALLCLTGHVPCRQTLVVVRRFLPDRNVVVIVRSTVYTALSTGCSARRPFLTTFGVITGLTARPGCNARRSPGGMSSLEKKPTMTTPNGQPARPKQYDMRRFCVSGPIADGRAHYDGGPGVRPHRHGRAAKAKESQPHPPGVAERPERPGLRIPGRNTVAVGSFTTGVAERPQKKSGRWCRIGAEAFVARASGRPSGAPPKHRR